MSRVITFGELMLRLQPCGYKRLVQAENLEATFGGAEANVAVALSSLGIDAGFVTRLPGHEMGQAAVNSLRRYGVDTQNIVRGGNRVGIYYNEKGADLRGGVCIYDRAGSAIAEASASDFDWNRIFDGAEWFHFTGITPALGEELPGICIDACRCAKEKGVTVSFDLNYRAKLWNVESARAVLGDICRYADIIIANVGQANDILELGVEGDPCDSDEVCREVAARLCRKFGSRRAALTVRKSHSAFDNRFGALLYDAESGECVFSRRYELHIVDRIGGGDAFAGGLIYALMSGMQPSAAVEFAAAASALKHSVEGDFNLVSAAEVHSLSDGKDKGQVKR